MRLTGNNKNQPSSPPLGPGEESFGHGTLTITGISRDRHKLFTNFGADDLDVAYVENVPITRRARGEIRLSPNSLSCGNAKFNYTHLVSIVRSGGHAHASSIVVAMKIKGKRYHFRMAVEVKDEDGFLSKLHKISMMTHNALEEAPSARQGGAFRYAFDSLFFDRAPA